MKTKTILIAVVLVALIGGATLLYNFLSERAGPSELIVLPAPSQQTGEPENPPEGQQTGEQNPPESQGGAAETSPKEEDAAETESQPPESPQEEAFSAPDFTVQDENGGSVRLSDMRGKPVVLNFWASWCPPCKSELPGFENVFNEMGEDVHFMMICIVDGARETIETGAAFIAESGYTFPVYFDVGQDVTAMYEIWSIPTTYFIDADGYIIAGAKGAISEETLLSGVEMIYKALGQ